MLSAEQRVTARELRLRLDRVPLPGNRLLRQHHIKRWRETGDWGDRIFAAWGRGPWSKNWERVSPQCRQAIIGQWKRSPAKARLYIRVVRARLQDEDNAALSVKPLVDALNKLGWLVDDSPEWVKRNLVEEACPKGPHFTEIMVTYLGPST